MSRAGCWLASIPAHGAGARRGRSWRSFLRGGITCFVDLTEDGELARYADLVVEKAAAADVKVPYYRLPIPDLDTPTEAQVTNVLDRIAHTDRVSVQTGTVGGLRSGWSIGVQSIYRGDYTRRE